MSTEALQFADLRQSTHYLDVYKPPKIDGDFTHKHIISVDQFDRRDLQILFDATVSIRKRIRQLYPKLRWEGEETWMGRRPSTVDSLPLLGPSPKAPVIHFAFGGQHLGLTMGARLGRMTADMVAGRKPNVDIAPYRVDRFDRK